MKIAFGMIVLNGNYVLEELLTTIYPYANQILIAEGPVKWWQDQGTFTSTDGTNEIIDNFPDPDNKISIVHGQYSEKDEQANAYMKYLHDDNDYIWNIDSDEIFNPEDIEKIFTLLEQEKITTLSFRSMSYYGGFDRVIGGFEQSVPFIRIRKVYPGSYWRTHRPPTIAHMPNIIPLPEKHLNFHTLDTIFGIRMYHYSYVFPDQVYNKIKYYEQYLNQDGSIKDYFRQVYIPWVTGDNNQKIEIENRYAGVHEWISEKRGEAYTKVSEYPHPKIILDSLPELKKKFDEQLEKYL